MSNLAFVKIPKTGTQTVEASLDHKANPCLLRAHLTVADFAKHKHGHDFMTMVRDPLQLYISAFYYIKNKKHAEKSGHKPSDGRPRVLQHHGKVIDAVATLEEYLLNAPANDFLSLYTAGTQLSDFIFVGETNHMDESLALLGKILGVTTKHLWKNKNPKRPNTLQPYWVSADVATAFKARNSGEYEVYAKGMERFDALKAKWL